GHPTLPAPGGAARRDSRVTQLEPRRPRGQALDMPRSAFEDLGVAALRVVNPSSGELVREVPCDDRAAVARKLERARAAQPRWQAVALARRLAELGAAFETFRR